MGERGIFRDILLIGIALVVVVELFVIMKQSDRSEERILALAKAQSDQQDAVQGQTQALRDILTELKKPGRAVVVAPNTGGTPEINPNIPTVASGEPPLREDWEKQYVDPKADPGGTLYRIFTADPGTLNPLTESDAFVSDIHQYISESLATRDYKNPDIAVPELATHWESAQASWGIPAKGTAEEIVAKLNAGMSPAAKTWIKPGVDNGLVKLEISKLGDGYLKEIAAALPPDAIKPVHWVATKMVPDAGDKDLPDAKDIMTRFATLIASKPELKLRGDQVWQADNAFAFRLAGDKAAAQKIVADFLAQKEQQGPKGPVWVLAKDATEDKTETFQFEDKLFFTFHLRPNIKWHDGKPLTAKDFLFSFKALKDPGVDCQSQRNYFQDCESLDAPDASTVRFTWRKLFQGAFLQSAGLSLVPEHIFAYEHANDFNTNIHNKEAFGTGPYKFKEWLPKQRIVLERNENYWGLKPNFKTIYIRIISESAVRLQMLKDKKIDITGLTPPQWINDAWQADHVTPKPPFGAEHGLAAVKQYDAYYNYIGWNALKPELSDKRVRRALTQCINRDGILKDLLYDLGLVVSGTFFTQSPYNDPNIKPWPYDPEAAKKLFAEAGWADHDGDGFLDKDGKKLEIKIRFPAASEMGKKILIAVQSDLKKAGVACELDPIEWAVFLTKIKKHEFDAMFLGWSLGWDPDPFQLWHSSQAVVGGSNHCSFVNKEADEIIERLRKTFDTEERIKLCHRFHAILQDEQPYTFMFNSMALVAHNADLRNVYLPLSPGEKRNQYIPIIGDHIFSRFWYMPKAVQRTEE